MPISEQDLHLTGGVLYYTAHDGRELPMPVPLALSADRGDLLDSLVNRPNLDTATMRRPLGSKETLREIRRAVLTRFLETVS